MLAPARATVLVVEDETDLQREIGDILRGAGYAVEVASNGREALDYLLAHVLPDLVLLDLQMPLLSGWDLLRIMRSYARLSKVPVLVVSGGERLATLSHEARLEKPVKPERLLEVIERLLPKP
jgi:CheY-like chemotaxis protein